MNKEKRAEPLEIVFWMTLTSLILLMGVRFIFGG